MSDTPVYIRNIVAPKKFLREYTEEIADDITDYYISGSTIAQIARMPGMPTAAVIYRWMKEIGEFRRKMDNAKTIRALALADEALETARESYSERNDKDKVSAARLLFDAATWTAEKNDPISYGKQLKVEGGLAPMTIVVRTGVPDAIDDTTEEKVLSEPQPTNAITDESGEAPALPDSPLEGA